MQLTGTSISCGVYQIHDLHPVHNSVRVSYAEAFLNCYRQVRGYTHILFSDANYIGNGTNLAKELEKYGQIATTGERRSASTTNMIEVWIWSPSVDTVNNLDKILADLAEARKRTVTKLSSNGWIAA